MTAEPADRRFVALRPPVGDVDIRVYLRNDSWAARFGHGDAHWYSRTFLDEEPRTWGKLCRLGRIALMGEFQDLSESESLYFCPASGEVESPGHGGFDVCCDRPDLHQPLGTTSQPSGGAS